MGELLFVYPSRNEKGTINGDRQLPCNLVV